jgi:hypothetical protein
MKNSAAFITTQSYSLAKSHSLFMMQIRGRISIRKNMIYKRKNDNLYPTGTVISTKANPDIKLVIMKYIHQTYYCSVLGDAGVNLKYKEKDLVLPGSH